MIALKQKKLLEDFFQKEPVTAIYLFGSQAQHKQGPMSDIDFAVLFSQKTTSGLRFDKKTIYFSAFAKIFSFDDKKIDIVNLNDVSFPVAFSAIKGKVIYEQNKIDRVNYEVKIMAEMATDFYFINRDYNFMIEKVKKGTYFYGT